MLTGKPVILDIDKVLKHIASRYHAKDLPPTSMLAQTLQFQAVQILNQALLVCQIRYGLEAALIGDEGEDVTPLMIREVMCIQRMLPNHPAGTKVRDWKLLIDEMQKEHRAGPGT